MLSYFCLFCAPEATEMNKNGFLKSDNKNKINLFSPALGPAAERASLRMRSANTPSFTVEEKKHETHKITDKTRQFLSVYS